MARSPSPSPSRNSKKPVETISAAQTDIAALPDRVAIMRERILEAVDSGEIEKLRPAVERNEMMPLFGEPENRPRKFSQAIDFFRTWSHDGKGKEVLFLLGNILNAPWVKIVRGKTVIYAWPAIAYDKEAASDAARMAGLWAYVRFNAMLKLSSAQKSAETTPGPQAKQADNGDAGALLRHVLRVEIGEDGTWHYFAAR